MTNPKTEPPLERLSYFNGQRLEAVDLYTEQNYHMRVRRLLNQALYTRGIVSGVEVRPDPENLHQAIVSPGVVLDAFGREVILLDETRVPVRGLPNTNPAWVYGNYLYIQYEEETTDSKNDGCSLGTGNCQLAWGGPTRIRAVPLLAFADTWPREEEGPIILAQVELDSSCAVAQIHNAARKYVDAAKSATRSVSYEGEKDIDKDNPKTLAFHIRGGPATSVTLYLWASKFSSFFYTELGAHSHDFSQESNENAAQTHDQDTSHSHAFSFEGIEVEESGNHAHLDITADVNNEDNNKDSIKLTGSTAGNEDLHQQVNFKVKGGDHKHTLLLPSNPMTDAETVAVGNHTHRVEGDTATTGKSIAAVPSGASYSYLDSVHVSLDGVAIEDAIRAQLGDANGWGKLGNGTSAHKLVTDGTGPIALERISALNEGEHVLELTVDNDSGGNIRYNLYVE